MSAREVSDGRDSAAYHAFLAEGAEAMAAFIRAQDFRPDADAEEAYYRNLARAHWADAARIGRQARQQRSPRWSR